MTVRTRLGLLAISLAGVLVFTACQTGAAIPTSSSSGIQTSAASIVDPPRIVDVSQTPDSRYINIRLTHGTSLASAASLGRQYGLEMIHGPLIDGPWADGRFVFVAPEITIVANTPTTALVLFPRVTSHADRLAFFGQNHLRFMHWLRPDEDTAIALVELPPSNLHPELIDPIRGYFRIALPAGLDVKAVIDWATKTNLRFISYAPQTGVALVRPLSWTPPVVVRPQVRRRAASRPPPRTAPSNTTLYVQFAQSMTASDIGTLVSGLGLTLVDLSAANFATLHSSPSRIQGAIQLLSDMATVQCATTSRTQCGQGIGPMPVINGAFPQQQPLGQPTELEAVIVDGVLTLRWAAAPGATSYEVFIANSDAGPFEPLATAVGGSSTSYQVAALSAPGSSMYFVVLALHPCLDASSVVDCDVLNPAYRGADGISVGWTNPLTVAASEPAPPAAPSPAPTDPTTANSSDTSTAGADPSAAAPPQPPPAPAQAPQQTRAGASPLPAPAGLAASASDGHVVLSWQTVDGARAYRVYRSTGDSPAGFVAQTPQPTFTDVGGITGTAYAYVVAAIGANGLLGAASPAASVVWAPVTSAPTVVRALPAQAQPLSGIVRFEIDVQSPSGGGSVEWKVAGAAGSAAIGRATGHAVGAGELSWSAAATWDTGSLPDGTYAVTATVVDSGGPQVSSITQYRIENGAAITPTGLTALRQGSGVVLTWSQAASAGAASYEVFRDRPVSTTPMTTLSADQRTFSDEKVARGPHVYQLVLVDVAGHRSTPAVATIDAEPAEAAPAVPLAVDLRLPTGQALAPGGRATDRLLAVAPNVEGLAFEVTSDGLSWSRVGRLPSCAAQCALTYDIASLAPGPYAIRAVARGHASSAHTFIHEAAIRYSAPAPLTTAVGALGVTVTWNAPASAHPAYYVIERNDGGGGWRVLDRVSATTYIDSTAPPGAEIQYRVSAADFEGTVGQASDVAAASVPDVELATQVALAAPGQPGDLRVLASGGRAVLRWRPVSIRDGYLVERRSQEGAPFEVVGMTGTEMFADSPPVEADQYAYRVRALLGAETGPPSNEVAAFVLPSSPLAPMGDTSAFAVPAPPAGVKTSTSSAGVQVSWTSASGTPAATTYTVYRSDPGTGRFSIAAARLQTTSFVDAALPTGATYGYVVTASSPAGSESPFSTPSWVSVAPVASGLEVGFVAPSAGAAVYTTSDNILALAAVRAAAASAGVQFAISSSDGGWYNLPTAPIDPRAPGLPTPLVVPGGAALWGTALNATGLAPGSYRLRVQARDSVGHMKEQVENLYVADATSRGPPAIDLTTTPLPGGVHLEWVSSAAEFTVQRSVFGPNGPFDSIATTDALQFDDHTAIPGRSYTYRVLAATEPATVGTGTTVSAGAATAASPDGPTVDLGPVSRSQLAVVSAAAGSAPSLPSGLQAFGLAYEVDATSVATGLPVHRLADSARITFALPSSSVDAATAAVYHWDDASAAWVEEASSSNADGMATTATVDHFSNFVLAIRTPLPAGGGAAQPPAPTADFGGGGEPSPPIDLTTPQATLKVAADGEVTSLRTANSRVYRLADGSMTQIVSGDLLNFRDDSGTWQKIDTTLVNGDTAGYMTNAAGPLRIQLPVDSASPVRVGNAAGGLAFSVQGALPSRRASGASSASYARILSGVDASYTVVPNGLKESLVLSHRPVTTPVFVFNITTSGLDLEQLADGTVVAVDRTGATQFTLTAPWMHDAANADSELGDVSNDISVTLVGGGGSYKLTYMPDAAWLADPTRRYPVTIDPSFTANDQYDDQINNYSPNFNYHGYTYMPVGYTYYSSPCCGSAPSRGMIQFSNASILYDGVYATSATFYAYQYTDYDCSRSWEPNGTVMYTSAAAGSWTYTGVTWANKPTYTDTFGYGTATTFRCSFGWLGFNVLGIVQAWETHTLTNNGFVMHATAESGNANNSEDFYGFNSGTSPYLSINYTTYGYVTNLYQYVGAGQLSPPTTAPNGGVTAVELILQNVGLATWLTDTRLSYRWWENGAAITNYADNPSQYVPYNVPGGSAIILRFKLVVPARSDAGPIYIQFAVANNTFAFSSLYWGASPSYACDEFYYNSSTPSCTVNSASPITLADESASISASNLPSLITASAGSLVSIPVSVTNTVPVAKWSSWSSTNANSTVLIGSRDYRTQPGGVVPMANLRTFLAQDVVGAGGAISLNVLLQTPADPGDYSLRIDLVHQSGTTITWFADKGNIPLEVPLRVVAAGDDKTTLVTAPMDDGTSLGTNTTNGQAVLQATDLNVPELGATSLHVARIYNGSNAGAFNNGTGATSLTYGAGWTFDFMRSLRMGALGPDVYSSRQGIYTDSQGRSWIATWNPGRGLWEIPAVNLTISASTSTVVSSHGSLTVPAIAPVDVVSRGANMLVADSGAPRGWALNFVNAQPDGLIIPASQLPSQQNGTLEFKVKLNFASTDAGTHTLFADTLGRFKLTWAGNALSFTTGDADGSPTTVTISALGWTNNGTWHHVGVVWNEGGAIQLIADSLTSPLSTTRVGQSPTGDLYFGYDPSAGAANPLNGWIAEIRMEGQVLAVNTIKGDTGALTADAWTLYLGAFDPAHGLNSVSGTYLLRNPDQSIEEYNAVGQLIDEQDRVGNKITFAWDANGRITTISDAIISGRTITFSYGSGQFTATDFSGRTVTYGINANGDLVSVVRSNQVPNPLTGTYTSVPTTTTYAYLPGHVLSQVVDPRGGRTSLTYDQSYKSTVIADGPAGYWRLGETYGTVAADSAGTNSATIVGAPTLGLPGAIYRDPNTSIDFNGTTQYVRAGPSPLGAGAFGLEAWVNHGGTAWSAGRETVVSLQGGNTYVAVTAGALTMYATIGGVQQALPGGLVPTSGWHQVAGTWDGSYLRVYLDGALSATGGPYTGSTSLGGNVLIATYDTSTNMFNGQIDEVAAYPIAIAASDLQAHFLAGRLGGPTAPGAYAANVVLDAPVGYWRLGESSGTVSVDQSGYGRQGAYTGGVILGEPGALSGDPATSAGFDGATGSMTVASAPTGSTSMTIEAWFYKTNQSTAPIVEWDSSASVLGVHLWTYPTWDSVFVNFVDTSGTGHSFSSAPGVLTKNTWYHLVAVYDASTGSGYLYLNGLKVAQSTTLGSFTPQTSYALHVATRPGTFFGGSVEEVAVYPYAMVATRVLAHYQSGVGRAPLSTELGPPSYAPVVLADNPAGYWRLGDTAGTTALNQINGAQNGTYAGGYTLTEVGAIAGETDTAVLFNGSSGYVSVTDSPTAFGTPQVSVEAWINANSWVSGASIINRRTTPGNIGGYTLEVANTSGQLNFFVYIGASWSLAQTPVVSAGVWHHVVGTYDGAALRVYVDGTLVATTVVSGVVTNPTGPLFLIGKNINGASYFSGFIDEAAVYGTALSAARILAHFQAGRPSVAVSKGNQPVSYTGTVAADNPIGYYRLDEVAGPTAFDRSGLANAATYSGTLLYGQPGALATDGDAADQFDGSTGTVTLNLPQLDTVSGHKVTVELWMFPLASANQMLFGFTAYGLYWIPNVGFGFNTGNGDLYGVPLSSAPLNRWLHIVAVFTNGGVAGNQLFINGVQQALKQLQGSSVARTLTPAARISGWASDANYKFNGLIDDVSVYNGALSPARVVAHYRAGRSVPSNAASYSYAVTTDTPIGYWRLGDASGPTASAVIGTVGTYSGTEYFGEPGEFPADTNTSVRFDGATGTVSLTALPVNTSSGKQTTVELWLYWLGGAAVQMPFGFSQYGLELNPAFGLGFTTNGTDLYGVTTAAAPANTWLLVDAVFTNSGITSNQLYINGIAQTLHQLTGTAVNRTVTTTANISGWPFDANYKFNGLAADVSIYNGALAANRILAHYGNGLDLDFRKVNAMIDARGNPIATFFYNSDLTVTRVMDARGLNSYYTFQGYGGRTLSITDTGGNVTKFVYDGTDAYRLIGTVSPSGIQDARIANSNASVGLREQTFISYRSAHPGPSALVYMDGSAPVGASLQASGETWLWDSSLEVNPGHPSHRSTPAGGLHEHYLTGAPGVPISSGTLVTQWVYIQAGVDAPDELALQFLDETGSWNHRAHWGFNIYNFGAADVGAGLLPPSGAWVQLSALLDSVGMNGHTVTGIRFSVIGGSSVVWWAPTVLQFPGAAVGAPTNTISTTAYNQYNDAISSLDANAIASITDVNAQGQPRQAASGVQPLTGHTLSATPVATGSDGCAVNGVSCTALGETQPAGTQSDIWQDFGPFPAGTRVAVSASVVTSGGGPGGAVLVVEDSPTYASIAAGQRTAPLQTGGSSMTLTVPFVVDQSRYIRVLLWQENFAGSTAWTAPVISDIDPAPDTTIEASTIAYGTDFEQLTDRNAWAPTAGLLQDASNAHGGQWSAHESLSASTGDVHFYRSVNVLQSSDYQLSTWVRTLASGSSGGTGGASLVVTTTETGTTIATSQVLQTEGRWQQLQLIFNSGTNTSINIRLDQANFRGDVYFDDLSVSNLSDSQGVMNWAASNPGNLIGVTVRNLATGGLAGGGARQVSMPSSSAVNQVQDALQIVPLRNGATYVISVWASSSLATGSIDFSLRDANKGVIPMGLSSSCSITTALTLCQNYATWNGPDNTSGYLMLMYGGSTSARTVTIAHPLVALGSQKFDFTTRGQPSHVYDVFGRSVTSTYDSNGLYLTQVVVTATPSPNLTTNFTNNSIGMAILSTRVNGSATIAEQTWRDSWGRVVGVVENCVTAAAPPTRCTKNTNAATNVLTRYAFDLNGNLTDSYTQGTVSGTWVDSHSDYDADGNPIDLIANYVPGQPETASQNVTTRSAYDAAGELTDVTSPAATAGGSTVTHAIYDTARRPEVAIANYVVGAGPDSQTNVTTTTNYDADGRVTTVWTPAGAGQIPTMTTYDAIGRAIRQVVGSSAPPAGFTAASAQTDWTLDAGGRITDILGPGTGSPAVRYTTHYDLDALGRKLSVTQAFNCPGGCPLATIRYVYDPRGATVVYSPPTQQLAGGVATRTVYDLAGHVTSTIDDWQSGAGSAPDLNVTTSITYDGYGRAISQTDPRGIVTQTTYDGLDRPSSETLDPSVLKLTWTYTYGLAGDQIQMISPRNGTNRTDQTVYDQLHRPVTVYQNCVNCLTNGAHDYQTNVESDTTYDAIGNVLTTTDPLRRVWDPLESTCRHASLSIL